MCIDLITQVILVTEKLVSFTTFIESSEQVVFEIDLYKITRDKLYVTIHGINTSK